jgi:hypothetical protein
MATLGASGSSNTSPRWGRTGEPGSAFSGLSRGRGRGRGSAGGSTRGGRGRAREGLSEVDIPSTKPDNSRSSTSPSTKSSISPSLSIQTPDEPHVPPSFSSKPKTAPRRGRGSRAIHVTTAPQINESVVTASTPTPAKVTHKRRRSQAGKPAFHVPPKANAPTLTDTPLRSNKLHHECTETLKHIPPHLNGKFDVRNDIDALVERVRAVAMDRPSTPKNHIDWAVDDDDTLPDLDDWGVTTSTLTTQLEGISPIIVDGLRSLPEFAANPTVPSPLKQVEAVAIQPITDAQSSSVNGMASDIVPPNPRSTMEEDVESKFSSESMAKCDPRTAVPLDLNSVQPNVSLSLHPSLPNKPLSVDSIVQHTSELRPSASLMQFVPHPTSPITPMVDLSGTPERLPAANSKQTDSQEPVEVEFETSDHKAATWTPESRLKGPDQLIVVEPITESVILNVSPNRGPGCTQTAQEPSPSGLRASMHAPKGIVNSVSTPANLSTHVDSRTHDHIHTHMRAHTVGRSPLPNSTIHGQEDYISRVTRSGHTTPRGGFQGTNHARTRSTPPGGANHYRSPHTSRPVITGDAISRLARTIEKTHNDLSPPISDS